MEKTKELLITDDLKKKNFEMEKSLTCPECKKVFSQKRYLKKHYLIHTKEKLFKCNHCDKAFIDNSRLSKHKRTHTGEKPFKCVLCQKTFSQSWHLKVHIRSHVGDKPHQCDECEKSFLNKNDLNKHVKLHLQEKISPNQSNKKLIASLTSPSKSVENTIKTEFQQGASNQLNNVPKETKKLNSTEQSKRNFKCDCCDKYFSQKNLLILHLNPDIPFFECDLCKNIWFDRTLFVRHLQHHPPTNNEEHKCDECGRIFVKIDNLFKHQFKAHGVEKSHKCDTCEEVFSKSSLLLKHIKDKHTRKNERFKLTPSTKNSNSLENKGRTFDCDMCRKSFLKRPSLYQHRRVVHLKNSKLPKTNYPYSCQFCDKNYKKKWSLEEHLRSHTGEGMITCKICFISFTRISHLRLHETLHKNKNEIFEYEKPQTERYPISSQSNNLSIQNSSTSCNCVYTSPNKCSNCQSKSNSYSNKEYFCIFCNSNFKKEYDFIIHLQKHDDEKYQELNVKTESENATIKYENDIDIYDEVIEPHSTTYENLETVRNRDDKVVIEYINCTDTDLDVQSLNNFNVVYASDLQNENNEFQNSRSLNYLEF